MRLLGPFVAVVVGAALVASAGETPDAGIARDVLALVQEDGRRQPTVTPAEGTTTIAFDAMTYQVHRPNRVGWMQAAAPERGPRAGGVVIEIQALAGPYGGPMELPQVLRGPYYATWCNALEEEGRHHFVRARFGHDFPLDLRERILARLGMGPLGAPALGPARLAVPVPVTVDVDVPAAACAAGQPMRARVTLHNGLRTPIRFPTFALTPTPWHGEMLNVRLPDVFRDGGHRNLRRGRPTVAPPDDLSGPTSHVVPAGGSLRLEVDLAQWTIAGGWQPGTYACVLQLERILVDGRTTLAVQSAPFRLLVK